MLPEINLLPKIERQSSVHYIIFLSGLIICLLLFSALIYFYLNAKSDLNEVNRNISQLEQEKTILEQRINNLDTGDETDVFEKVATFVEQQIIPTSNFIDELLVLLPEHGYLSNYAYNYQSVQIETQFETMTAAADYVEDLNSSDYIKNVQVNTMNTFELGDAQDDNEEIYSTIPRYTVNITIEVDEQFMIQEGEGHE
ncbi:PilN domain-containing protein [Paucisalibacillus globulus]|uniref:PilN domain-containing protein n=1 Tax=Paucisalibacillus globulus TaxID=351095 RepID=UPI000408E326|nr:hypothetical protein [Paucisalibacillus globulus]